MKKYIISKNNPNMIREYNIEDNIINITYSDGSTGTVPFARTYVEYLDALILKQYEDFNNDVELLLTNNSDELAISAGAGALAMAGYMMTSSNDDNALLVALTIGLGTTAAIEAFFKISKEEEIIEDYRKDRALVENYDDLERVIMNESSYEKLSNRVQTELKDVHEGIIPLSINSVKNLNIRDLSKMLWLSHNEKNPKKKIRK